MKLSIFGGTGRTGRVLVRQALEARHDVRVLARRPAVLEELAHDRLSVVEGDVRDEAAMAEALAGAEAALSTLGPPRGSSDDLLRSAARSIVAGKASTATRRLVWLTGAGVRHEHDEPKLVDRAFVAALKLTQRRLLEDSIAAVEAIRASDLDWTIVRAPRLVDGPGSGDLRVGLVDGDSGTKASRAEVTAFMLRERWIRATGTRCRC